MRRSTRDAAMLLAATVGLATAAFAEATPEKNLETLKEKLLCVRCDLTGIKAPGIDLRGAKLAHAILKGADLSNAWLNDADLPFARLDDANLYKAKLIAADLRGASLRGANLDGAKLQGSNLTGADLRGASLGTARLRGTELRRTQLQGVDLTNVVGLNQPKLDDACGDETTKLPRNLTVKPCEDAPEEAAEAAPPGDGSDDTTP